MNLTNEISFQEEENTEPLKDIQGESIVIPVIEEQVQVSKKMIETGRVQVSKTVSEEKKLLDIPLDHEEVNIERVVINQYVDDVPAPVRYEGDTMIIPVLKEVIQKRLMIAEEIRVTRKQVQTTQTQQVTLQKEEVTVERKQTGDINH